MTDDDIVDADLAELADLAADAELVIREEVNAERALGLAAARYGLNQSSVVTPHTMRAPCRRCESLDGEIRPTNGQDCVFCLGCGLHAYNAPRTETGRAVRSLASRPDIKPRQRARIFARDGFACLVCRHTDRPLVIGHLISVHEGRELGMADTDLFADENLAAFCEEDNAGLHENSVPSHLLWRLWRLQVRQREHRES